MTFGDSVVAFARTQVGVTELTGHNDGPEVEAYLKSTKLGPGYPYCGSFQHYCYRQCGKVLKPEQSFASAAYWHQPSHRIWERGAEDLPTKGKPGDAVGYYFPKLKRVAHTEIFEREQGEWIYVIGANTSDSTGVVREGGGVWAKKRLRRLCTYVSRW